MNCHQVRTHIDGRPTPRFAAPTPGDVRRHLEVCADCREARQAVEALEQRLKRLPSPKPPHSIAQAVSIRITEGPRQPHGVADTGQERPRRSAETLCWVLMLAGMVLGAVAGGYQVLANAPAGLRTDPVLETLALPGSSVQLLLGMGALLYLSGLVQWIERDTAYED